MINLLFASSKLICCLGLSKKIKLNRINAKTKGDVKGNKESPSKMPHLISAFPNSEFPVHDITLHFSMLLTNKVFLFSATPNKSKHSLIYECGSIS